MSDVHFDYEMVLFIGVLLSLMAYIILKMYSKKNKSPKNMSRKMAMISSLAGFFPIFLIILSIRSFAFEPFRIPSSSMMPTLLTGDFIYVNKSAYGIKAPVFHNTLIQTGHPKRGEVFVFRSVEDPSIDIIKRVIAVPGDHVKYDERTKEVFVNGVLVKSDYDGPYKGFHDDINPKGLSQRQSSLGDQNFTILQSRLVHHQYKYTELVVPQGHYFGMGDNRDFSSDSRVFGLVPEKNVVGRAEFIWMHWRPDDFLAGLKRIGQSL